MKYLIKVLTLMSMLFFSIGCFADDGASYCRKRSDLKSCFPILNKTGEILIVNGSELKRNQVRVIGNTQTELPSLGVEIINKATGHKVYDEVENKIGLKCDPDENHCTPWKE